MISDLEPTLGPAKPLPLYTTLLASRVAVVDYETYWNVNYSVSSMSYWHYCHHELFDAYLVSIVTNDGFEWVGHPSEAPWDRIRDYVWVSHNAPFDRNVHMALQEKNVVPSWNPIYWGNSINLCAFIRAPRALAKAVKALYGQVLSKDIRDKETKGKRWAEYSDDLKARAKEYALNDARWALKIWMEKIKLWPERERRAADLIDNRGLHGLHADKEGMERDMALMRRLLQRAEDQIPWKDSEALLSAPALHAECRKVGIEGPSSLDMKDAALHEWEDKYGEQYPWVGAMRDWRRINGVLQKYLQIYNRIKPNGRFEYPVSYMGTHTGRTSGKDKGYEGREGFNILNLPRDPFYIREDLSVVYRKKDLKAISAHFDKLKKAKLPRTLPEGIIAEIDVRAKIIAAPGHKLVICDKAQIEARITNWIAKEIETLELIRKGYSVYDSHAIAMMGYIPEVIEGKPVSLKKADPQQYALAKARELALGFQAGHIRFIEMAPTYISDEEFEVIFNRPVPDGTEAAYLSYLKRTRQQELLLAYPTLDTRMKLIRLNSWIQVEDFRRKKRRVVALWKQLDNDIRRAAMARDAVYEIELPSGRTLTYFSPQILNGKVRVQLEIGGEFKDIYGGKALENAVQAIARDVFIEDQMRLDDHGICVVMDIYDEVVAEVSMYTPGSRVLELMCVVPEWAQGGDLGDLPIGAEMEETLFYKK